MTDRIMEEYYRQKRVRRAIIDFVYSGFPDPIRECAFFNEDVKNIQRHISSGSSILVLDSEEVVAELLNRGSSAFYASYWRYSDPNNASDIRGRDLAWSIKAEEGGLSATKELTEQFLAALEKEGFPDPLVKYSGELGFDVMIPMEKVAPGSSRDLKFLTRTQEKITVSCVDFIDAKGSFDSGGEGSKIRFKGRLGTCLLTELRWRRGLILAPMSLHPRSGLVSVPVQPREIPDFSVLDATPKNVQVRRWGESHPIRDRENGSVQYTLGRFSPGIKA
ncbi:MAG: hypothetical protein ACLFUR_00860 [Candidatus Hadarchaeia archaeon]